MRFIGKNAIAVYITTKAKNVYVSQLNVHYNIYVIIKEQIKEDLRTD